MLMDSKSRVDVLLTASAFTWLLALVGTADTEKEVVLIVSSPHVDVLLVMSGLGEVVSGRMVEELSSRLSLGCPRWLGGVSRAADELPAPNFAGGVKRAEVSRWGVRNDDGRLR